MTARSSRVQQIAANGATAPTRRPARPTAAAIKTALTEPQAPDAPSKSAPARGRWLLWDLGNSQCRWPHGDGPFTFCGAERVDDPRYCPEHAALFYARR